MKKVFAVLAISTLVAFTSCKKADDAATTATDSTANKAVETIEATKDSANAKIDSTASAATDSVKKAAEEVKH